MGDLKQETQLPPPASAARSASGWTLRRRIGVLAALALVLYPLASHHWSDDTVHDVAVESYWDGIVSKGAQEILQSGHGKHSCHWIPPKRAEKIYLSVPTNDSVAAASKRYTAHAHPGGSGWDLVTALQVKNDWERELGLRVSGADEYLFDAGSHESQKRVRGGMNRLSVWIDTYYPVLNTPVSSSVTVLADPPIHAKLREAKVDGDPDSELADEVRVFHGLSVSGDVTGKYVYAGYGRKVDFDLLQSKGIDFTNTIAVVKYGGVFRGLKVKAAQEAGAIGCIIFTDPGDDGEITADNGYEVYPAGPARVPSSVQRGSVQFLSMYPGDPTTPGEPAYKNATRGEGANMPSIPSLPMSYEDAIPILKQLNGKGLSVSDLDDSFSGGLGSHGVEYFTGPSEVDLHLVNQVNTRVMPIWNTMAVIPGHITDEVVIMGNHRDAWVLGGSDPNSGTASQYEMVRGLGKLLRKGWKPMRSIVLASWDAEEYGLVGSTEWAEDFGSWLTGNAAAYLNLDASSAGSHFHASASPSLARVVRGAAEDVERSSNPGESVWNTRLDSDSATGITPLGSGSDYTAFLMRYGIASTDFSFGGGPKDPVYHYHSIYDSHTWVAKYGDPGFHKHTDGTKIIGLIALRIADSVILPLNTTQYAHDLDGYLSTIEEIKRSDESFESLNLDALGDAIRKLQEASAKYDERRGDVLRKLKDILEHKSYWEQWREWASMVGGTPSPRPTTWESSMDEIALAKETTQSNRPRMPRRKWRKLVKVIKEIREINIKLRDFESGFISEDGIKDREWYKHKGTSPGKWLGYGATTFPALTEALTIEKNAEMAQGEADELADMISAMADRLK